MEQENEGTTTTILFYCFIARLFCLITMHTKISELRKKLGITQEELAEKCGVTRQTIISLESGRYNPSLLLTNKITEALKQKHIEDVFIIKK